MFVRFRSAENRVARPSGDSAWTVLPTGAGENYNRYDSDFHIAIARATGNRVLTRMFPIVLEAVKAGYARTVRVKGSTEAALVYHARIPSAIEAGDAGEAARLMESHLRQTLADMNDRQRGETT